MKIIVEAEPKEIAELLLAIKERQNVVDLDKAIEDLNRFSDSLDDKPLMEA